MTRESSRAASRMTERESRFNQPGRTMIAASFNGKPSEPDVLPVQDRPSIAHRVDRVLHEGS